MHDAIKQKLGCSELLAQLAEEAAELAHAALKMRRTLDDTNPANVDSLTAWYNLLEEIADERNCTEMLIQEGDEQTIRSMQQIKMRRWEKRLAEVGGKDHDQG